MEKYANKVRKGAEIIVMKHNKPFFQMTKPKDIWGDEGEWKTVVDFTKIRKGGVLFKEVFAAFDKLKKEEQGKRKRG